MLKSSNRHFYTHFMAKNSQFSDLKVSVFLLNTFNFHFFLKSFKLSKSFQHNFQTLKWKFFTILQPFSDYWRLYKRGSSFTQSRIQARDNFQEEKALHSKLLNSYRNFWKNESEFSQAFWQIQSQVSAFKSILVVRKVKNFYSIFFENYLKVKNLENFGKFTQK